MKIRWYSFLVLIFLPSLGSYSQTQEVVYLWPNQVPGSELPKQKPIRTPDRGDHVVRLTNVTNPAFTVFGPDLSSHNHTGIIVCPGGGYNILAINKEGDEVASWLNSLGYTAFVLQYRVPNQPEGALSDLQRALRIIRANATKWDLDPDKIGVMGFSAGGNLAARISTTLPYTNTYSSIDGIDTVLSKPNFTLLIYAAYLDEGPNQSLSPALQITNQTPPMFLFATADDKHANGSLVMTTALRDAGVPVELHLLPSGGHGYGLRKGNPAAENWPTLAASWLKLIANMDE